MPLKLIFHTFIPEDYLNRKGKLTQTSDSCICNTASLTRWSSSGKCQYQIVFLLEMYTKKRGAHFSNMKI